MENEACFVKDYQNHLSNMQSPFDLVSAVRAPVRRIPGMSVHIHLLKKQMKGLADSEYAQRLPGGLTKAKELAYFVNCPFRPSFWGASGGLFHHG